VDPYQETFNTWDKIAKLYHEQFMDLEYYNESYDLFCNLIKNKQQQILELACGPGNISKHILKQLPNAE
jgi:ubiquinone/menaquinone biosynthesis C-methylase UbiE